MLLFCAQSKPCVGPEQEPPVLLAAEFLELLCSSAASSAVSSASHAASGADDASSSRGRSCISARARNAAAILGELDPVRDARSRRLGPSLPEQRPS